MASPETIQLQVNNQSGMNASITGGQQPYNVPDKSVKNFTVLFGAQVTFKVDVTNKTISIDVTSVNESGSKPHPSTFIQLSLWLNRSFGRTFTKIIEDTRITDPTVPLDVVIQLYPAPEPLSSDQVFQIGIQEVRSGDGNPIPDTTGT